MSAKTTIEALIIADSAESARLVAGAVTKAGFNIKGKMATDKAAFDAVLQTHDWDVVLAAESLPESLGLAAIISALEPIQMSLFVITTQPNEALRYVAMNAGAADVASIQAPRLIRLLLERDFLQRRAMKIQPPHRESLADTGVFETVSLSPEDETWVQRINAALAQDRFFCVYQPIVNLNAEPTPNYELLLRMQDDNGSEVSPGMFLGSAEKSGLMKTIDRWVIQYAIESLSAKLADEPQTRFFVKLSRDSIRDPGLAAWLSEELYTAKLPEEKLVFELVQADVLADRENSTALINALKKLRCLVALDHVERARDIEEQLGSLTVDYIKLSGELMRHFGESSENQRTVQDIIVLARSKNIRTIAQFVQDPLALTFLWQNGANYIQGYYLQHPDSHLEYDFNQEAEG